MKPDKCKCGADARIRYKKPFTWVECKKKCGMKTGCYCDIIGEPDPHSQLQAITAWNRMVTKDG